MTAFFSPLRAGFFVGKTHARFSYHCDQRRCILTDASKRPRFDPTINLGHLLTFLGLCLAALGAYYGAKAELASVAMRLTIVEKQIEKMSQILITDARQDERTTAIERRLDRLEQQLHRSGSKSGIQNE